MTLHPPPSPTPPEPPDRWQEGYDLGWHIGYNAGQRHAEADMDRAWAEMARKIRATGDAPSHAELVRRRAFDRLLDGQQ